MVQHLIADMLRDFAGEHGGFAVASPIDIVFSDYDVLQPDVVFFKADRRQLVDFDRVIRDPPDLGVEVISPSTQESDSARKMQMFARFGVPVYRIVDPRARPLEVYRLALGILDASSKTCPARASSSHPPSPVWPSSVAGLCPSEEIQ